MQSIGFKREEISLYPKNTTDEHIDWNLLKYTRQSSSYKFSVVEELFGVALKCSRFAMLQLHQSGE
jgi:hypothetical protein